MSERNRVTDALAAVAPPRLTLWDIETAWLELIQARAEAEEIPDDPERTQAIVACDQALAEYVAREVAKVDGIRGVIRALAASAAAAKFERDYQAKRAESCERIIARIKRFAQSAMEAAGKKRIDGRTGYLALKGNGGVEPLVITDPAMLPSEYRDITVKLPEHIWRRMCIAFGCPQNGEGIGVESLSVAPANGRIRAAMAEGGGVPGAYLEPRGSHVEIR